MTEYVIEGHRLLACWRNATHGVAAAVAEMPSRMATDAAGRDLTAMLTDLSRAAWDVYTRPAEPRPGAADGSEHREDAAILEAIRHPDRSRHDDDGERGRTTDGDAADQRHRVPLPPGHRHPDHVRPDDPCPDPPCPELLCPELLCRHDPRPAFRRLLRDHAAALGRLLCTVQVPKLTDAVVREVRTELAAVRRAEKGDLTGRAEQAVHLDRAAVAPRQVVAADQVLFTDPLGDPSRLSALDPAACAVAAAHWLQCAVTVVADECCLDVDEAVAEAALVHPVSPELPTFVLTRLEAGRRPADVVLELIQEALSIRDGRLPSPAALQHRLADRLATVERHAACHPHVALSLTGMRLTHLDPVRPARSLLHHLLEAVRACASLYVRNLSKGGRGADVTEDSGGADVESLLEDWIDATRAEVRTTRYRLY